jgi:hypothetical protein
MSWSVSLIGSPAKVKEALVAQAAKQSGQCKAEMDAALPHILGLVDQNYVTEAGAKSGYTSGGLVKVEASGSGSTCGDAANPGKSIDLQRTCKVLVEPLYGNFVG